MFKKVICGLRLTQKYQGLVPVEVIFLVSHNRKGLALFQKDLFLGSGSLQEFSSDTSRVSESESETWIPGSSLRSGLEQVCVLLCLQIKLLCDRCHAKGSKARTSRI